MPNVVFRESWKKDPLFTDWVETTKNEHEAYCTFCKKIIDIESMGRSALVSHAKGKKHNAAVTAKSQCKGNGVLRYFSKSEDTRSSRSNKPGLGDTTSSSKPDAAQNSTLPSTSSSSACNNLNSFVTDATSLTSEIWWCLHTAINNHSASSNKDIDFYLKQMFPCDPMVNKFSCGETKTMYLMVFGLAPFFKTQLLDQVSKGPFSIMFDESLNKSVAKKQLDVHLRFWNNGSVQSRYLDSHMLGHATAEDLLEALISHSGSIPFQNIAQLSMDGPNVNWALFDKFSEKLRLNHGTKLMNIGSCGLHQLHNAMRKGMKDSSWDLEHILSSAYYLFKDVPARREDYMKITDSTVFPLKFCAHRWVENQRVMLRLKEIMPKLKIYFKSVRDKKLPNPSTKSFETLRAFLDDPLAECKLSFSISICKPVEQFLVGYQADAPLFPFLYADLMDLISRLAKRIVKADVLESSNLKELSLDADTLVEYSKVDLGTEVTELLKKSKCTPRQNLDFRMKCRQVLVSLIGKLLAKSPLKYTLCKNLQFLNPTFVVKNSDQAVKFLKSTLLKSEHCNLDEVDDFLHQFENFVKEVKTDDGFLSFKRADQRVDELFFNSMAGKEQFGKLWQFVMKCLVISHGQATVERGFSENKEALADNMQRETLCARRTIKDHIRSIGGVKNFKVTKQLVSSCNKAHQRYLAYLEEKREQMKVAKTSSKRKRVEEEVNTLKKRKIELEGNVKFLTVESDRNADMAEAAKETTKQLALFTTANALRKSAKEKQS